MIVDNHLTIRGGFLICKLPAMALLRLQNELETVIYTCKFLIELKLLNNLKGVIIILTFRE